MKRSLAARNGPDLCPPAPSAVSASHSEARQPARSGWLGRIGLSSLWLLAARVFGQGLGLLFTASLARALGEEGLGQFAFLSAVLFVGNAATTFGLDTVLLREIATARRDAAAVAAGRVATGPTAGAVLLIQLALSAVFIAVLWLVMPWLPNQTAATLPALRLVSLALVPLAFSTVYSAILRAHERMAHYMAFTLAVAVGLALGGLAIWAGGGGLTATAVVVVLAQSGGALVAAGLARAALPAAARRWAWPPADVVGRVARLGAGLAALMVLSILYQRSGVLLLSLLADDRAAGAYSAAARVVEALKMLPAAFFGAMFPIMAQGRGDADVERAFGRAFIALMALVVVLAAATGLAAGPLLALLFGPGYGAAVAPLRVMVWSLPATLLAFRLSFGLVVAGRDRAAAAAMGLTLLLGGGLTAALIGRWSLLGAAVGLVAGEVVQVVVLLALGRLGRPAGMELRR